MPRLKALGLFLGIGAIPVISLVRKAAQEAWVAPVSVTKALLMVMLVGGVLFVVATIVSRRLPDFGSPSVSAVGWAALLFVRLHVVRNELVSVGVADPWHWLVVIVVAMGFAVWIGTRFDPAGRYLGTFVPIAVVFMAVPLTIDIVRLEEPTPATVTSAVPDVGSPPSIWVIVLDAHASPKVLRDVYDVDLSESTSRLETAGFRVWDDARSNYSATLVSIPSLLSGEVWVPETVEGVYAEMLAGVQGDTPLILAMQQAGLEVRMVQASWSRSACGAVVDECFGNPRYDEHWYFLANSTLLPNLLPGVIPHPWPSGGLRAIEKIADVPGDTRHFTFVHSLASHPPSIIDQECELVSALHGRLLDQLPCMHDVLFEALSTIDLTTDIVIITADHGYAIDTTTGPPADWSAEAVRDRFSAFTAISTPDDCEDEIPDELSTAQILPIILNCYGAELPVPDHRFLGVIQRNLGGLGATELDWDGWSAYQPKGPSADG